MPGKEKPGVAGSKSLTACYYNLNFDAIKMACLADAARLVTNWLPGGKREGSEYTAINPTRADNRPGSFKINLDTGQWADFATGDKGGDLIGLYAYLNRLSQGDAARELADITGTTQSPPPNNSQSARKWNPITPIPDAAPPAPAAHPRHGKPSGTWTYRDATGQALCHVCRFDTAPDTKQFASLSFCRNEDGNTAWRWQDLPAPRPLYNLHLLAARPGAVVAICEGEKAADAAAILLPDMVTTTSQNGSNSSDKADWTHLAGRDCAIWPDNDEPGRTYAETVTRLLMEAGAASVRVVNLAAFGHDLAEGWDAANALQEGWTAEWVAVLRGSPDFCITPAVGRCHDTKAPDHRELPPLDAYEKDIEPGMHRDSGKKGEYKGKPIPRIGEILERGFDYDWLIEGWIERLQSGVIFGDSQTCKTLIAIDQACCIAIGTSWQGCEVKQGGVVFIVGEGAGPGIRRRFRAWEIANGISLENAPIFVVEETTTLPDDFHRLITDISVTLTQAGVILEIVYLDTLSRTISGSERDSKDFCAYQRSLDEIRHIYQCATMFLHHVGHSDKSRERGASEIGMNADIRLMMETLPDGTRKLTPIKVKDAEMPVPLFFLLTPVDLGLVDKKDQPITSVVLMQRQDYHPPMQKKSLKDRERTALFELKHLLEKEEHPEGVHIATDWRHAFYHRIRVTTPEIRQETLRKAFERAVNTLHELGPIEWTGIDNTRAKTTGDPEC